jgi:hypothetical protein
MGDTIVQECDTAPSQKVRHVLLLTATITPPRDAFDLARVDVSARLSDYLAAFEYYLGFVKARIIDSIVFVENSSSDISRLVELAERAGLCGSVEFLRFDGLDYPPSYGRAYGEMRILDHAMKYAASINDHAHEPMIIWKATGRYIVRNLERIIAKRPDAFDLYCNMRNHPRRWVDMYLLGWTIHGYDAFLRDAAPLIRVGVSGIKSGVSPEELLRGVIEERSSAAKLVPRFAVVPIIEGYRGYDNRSYAKANRWKNIARNILLRVAPRLWI